VSLQEEWLIEVFVAWKETCLSDFRFAPRLRTFHSVQLGTDREFLFSELHALYDRKVNSSLSGQGPTWSLLKRVMKLLSS
jgi:hypothetical protein